MIKGGKEMNEYSIIGKRIPRIDSRLQVTGQAKYAADLVLPGMLFGKILRSPYPHARILNIDTSKAEKLPGVKAVITGKDTLHRKYGFFRSGMDRDLLPIDKVRFIGDNVAAVAAINEDTAEEALALIEVEYEELPAVFDPEEAMKEGAPRIHDFAERNIATERHWNFGDVEKGFKESDYVREDRFVTQSTLHGYIEPHACVANYDSSGKVTIWASTQVPFLVRRDLARTLDIPYHKIRVIKPHVGGGFGGKILFIGLFYCAVLLSQKTGRPVQIVYSMREDLSFGNRRVPVIYDLKTGVKKDGTLVAQHAKAICDGGAFVGPGPLTAYNTGLAFMEPYRLPNFKMDLYRAYTNKVYCSPQRGHGQIQTRFAVDCQLDMIAEDLGLDPKEVRARNALQTDEVTVSGLEIISSGLPEAIEKAAEMSGWKEKRGKQRHLNRGLGMACSGFPCGAMLTAQSDSAAVVELTEDGGVIVLTGASDIGQGINTIAAQIVAEVLGITMDDVTVLAADTEVTPYDPGSFSSRVTFYAGNAIKLAAEDARDQLAKAAAKQLGVSPQNIQFKDRWVSAKDSPGKKLPFAGVVRAAQMSGPEGKIIIGRGSFWPRNAVWPDPDTFYGNTSGSWSFSAQVAEVEVDKETGQVRVLKVSMADDCGYPLNTLLCEGQMEGSVSNAQGHALYEDLQIENGQVMNPSFMDYRMPTALDAPDEHEPYHVITNDPVGPFGAKEVGEGFINASLPCIINAIHDATGVWVKDLPVTPEKIVKALKEKGDS